ncbi:hypothetical protein [Mycolicibacterium frederiksbergense]|uniref:Uncharacterized protein n=1 Tax=Mycolicibacterium frederiksbergense TaxID=117567 RepID=A0A6H0S1G9_9MYCO|nr:hypothetical protein [Mycolicibacterium frederiksbergense]QIV79877.1 hypothetical protein EXE63_02405 [Mycolicibacterium frederiksbergense]
MRIDQNRLVPSTQARTTLPALLDAAHDGRIAHILRDGAVAAHLIPADLLVVTGNVEAALNYSVARHNAAWMADRVEEVGYRHAGDDIGRILAWTWECREDTAVTWFGTYVEALVEILSSRAIARPSFTSVWWALTVALRGFMLDGAIDDYEAAIRERLSDLGHGGLFGAAELAGQEVLRSSEDPWPHTPPFGGGWAKKRWGDLSSSVDGSRDLFVPNSTHGYAYGSDDDWLRVEAVDVTHGRTGTASLRSADGGQVVTDISAGLWTPYRTEKPWRWGI